MTNAERGSNILQDEPIIVLIIGILAQLNEASSTGSLRISRVDARGVEIGVHSTNDIDFEGYAELGGQRPERDVSSIAERAAAATRYVTTLGLANEAES